MLWVAWAARDGVGALGIGMGIQGCGRGGAGGGISVWGCVGCRVQDAGHRVQTLGCQVPGRRVVAVQVVLR